MRLIFNLSCEVDVALEEDPCPEAGRRPEEHYHSVADHDLELMSKAVLGHGCSGGVIHARVFPGRHFVVADSNRDVGEANWQIPDVTHLPTDRVATAPSEHVVPGAYLVVDETTQLG